MSRLPALGPRGEGWVALQLMLMLLVAVAGWFLGPDWDGALLVLAMAVGAVLVAAGAVLATLGIAVLDESRTALPHPVPGSPLIESGAYRFVRHPIYVGVMLAALGWALLSASVVALVLAGTLVLLLDLKARREEAWLRDHHPRYAAYARRVRRFIPGLY